MIVNVINLHMRNGDVINIPYSNLLRNVCIEPDLDAKGFLKRFSIDFEIDENVKMDWMYGIATQEDIEALADALSIPCIVGVELEGKNLRAYGVVYWNGTTEYNDLQTFKQLGNNTYRIKINM